MTGGGTDETPEPLPDEEKLLPAMGGRIVVEGDNSSTEFGHGLSELEVEVRVILLTNLSVFFFLRKYINP